MFFENSSKLTSWHVFEPNHALIPKQIWDKVGGHAQLENQAILLIKFIIYPRKFKELINKKICKIRLLDACLSYKIKIGIGPVKIEKPSLGGVLLQEIRSRVRGFLPENL